MNYGTSDPELFLLNITNIVLGLVVAALTVTTAGAILLELYARWRKRAAYMAEIEAVFGQDEVPATDPRAFSTPGLGLTMADGGEPIKPVPKTRRRKR